MKIHLALLAAIVLHAQTPEPRELLQQALSSQRKMRERAGTWTYEETITTTQLSTDGEREQRTQSGYEVIFLVDDFIHKLVSLNGKPLPPSMAQAEDKRLKKVAEYRRKTPYDKRKASKESKRFVLKYKLMLDHHDLKFAGEDTVNGRPAWVLEGTPRLNAKPDQERDAMVALMRCRVWIDKQDLVFVRTEGDMMEAWQNLPTGTHVVTELSPIEPGVWLTKSIRITAPRLSGDVETAQEYFNYRKFQTKTTIHFSDIDQ
jgi:hypothetical protein